MRKNEDQSINVISHLRLDFSGSEYEVALDTEIINEFAKHEIRPVVRGAKAPAAGVGLSVDIVITIVSGVASGLIVEAIKAVLKRVKASADKALSCSSCLGCLTVETDCCDYIITTNNSAGFHAEKLDYNGILREMEQLTTDEHSEGRCVTKIEAPCSLDCGGESLRVATKGVGNYSLWLVSYSEGERWPLYLYDANNQVFIPLNDEEAVLAAIDGEDRFYSL